MYINTLKGMTNSMNVEKISIEEKAGKWLDLMFSLVFYSFLVIFVSLFLYYSGYVKGHREGYEEGRNEINIVENADQLESITN